MIDYKMPKKIDTNANGSNPYETGNNNTRTVHVETMEIGSDIARREQRKAMENADFNTRMSYTVSELEDADIDIDELEKSVKEKYGLTDEELQIVYAVIQVEAGPTSAGTGGLSEFLAVSQTLKNRIEDPAFNVDDPFEVVKQSKQFKGYFDYDTGVYTYKQYYGKVEDDLKKAALAVFNEDCVQIHDFTYFVGNGSKDPKKFRFNEKGNRYSYSWK